jgi:hypothetical protein
MKPLPSNQSLIVWRKNYINSETRKFVRTICDVLRELHRDAEARKDTVAMQRLEEANDMAKRMQNKLKFYSLKTKDRTTLTVDDVGEMAWLNKEEYKARERG